MENLNTWRPNQSGTFSNRVSVHDRSDNTLFVIEHYSDDNDEKRRITKLIAAVP